MATIPNPKTWEDGQVPTASEFNAELRDTTNFFTHPPAVQVRQSANLADFDQMTWQLQTWDTAVFKTDGAAMHNAGTNPSRLVAQTSGRYEVWLNIRWANHLYKTGFREIAVRKGAAGSPTGGTLVTQDIRVTGEYTNPRQGASAQSCTGFVFLSANEYIEAFARHDQWKQSFIDPADSHVNHVVSIVATSIDIRTPRFGMVWRSVL